MKVNTFGRLALTAGIMSVAASGLVATPAYADPSPTLYSDNLVGFGSDTTQDVMQELSVAIGQNKLASFNSTYTSPKTNEVQSRPGGPTNVIRAKGSGDGFKMLQVAEGSLVESTSVGVLPSGSKTANKANTVGQIDYSRSSSGPATQSNTGEYVYIPFARDVIGIAVDPADPVSKIPLTFGASTDSAEVASVNSIFRCKARYVYLKGNGDYAGVGPTVDLTAAAIAAGGTTAEVITPLVPVFGSGTASFFIKAVTGVTDVASFPAGGSGFECIKRVKLDGTTPIQEHDGSSVAELTNSIGTYSIGQWVSQTKSSSTGVTDKTNGTVMAAVDGVAATTGVGATLAPNEAPWVAALKRFVYNVVAYRKAADETSRIHEMFVGTDSLVCTNTASIVKMGFSPLTGSDGGDPTSNATACGSIASANRATIGSDGISMATPATVTNVSAVNAVQTFVGRAFTVTVSGGIARHDMGGTVQILDAPYGTAGARVLGSAVIGEGQNITADVSVTPVATGTTKLYAYFVPKLGAIKVTNMSPVNADTDKSFATVTPSNPTTTKLSVRKPTKIGGTVRVVAWVGADGAFDGGTVKLFENNVLGAEIASDTLAAGETASVFTYTQSVTSRTLVATFTPANASANASTSANVTVTLSKETPTITWSALPAAPNGFVAGTSPFWANAAKRVQVTTANATVNATTDVVTTTAAHGLAKNDIVYLSAGTGTALPAGITAGTQYYVMPASGTTVTGSTFKVSATRNGTALNFTGTPPAVKVWKQNFAPKIALTVAAPAGVTLVPSGSVKVFIGTTSNDKSREISSDSSGLALVNGVLTATLSKADLWNVGTGNPGTTTPTTAYLIVEYPASSAFNAVTVFKQIRITP